MSHDHREDVVKNLLAFENHAQTDGCPHCMTKHILTVEQLLTEESEQSDGSASELMKVAKEIREELPSAYGPKNVIREDKMSELERKAREIRLILMKELGVPGHKHRDVEHVIVA